MLPFYKDVFGVTFGPFSRSYIEYLALEGLSNFSRCWIWKQISAYFHGNMPNFIQRMLNILIICYKIISVRSKSTNQLIKQIIWLLNNEIFNDICKLIFGESDVNSYFLFWLYFGKQAWESRGTLGNDFQQYFLTPCKNPACT